MFSRSSLHWDSFSGLYSVRFHSNGTLRFARAPGSVLEHLSSCYRPSLLTTWGKNLLILKKRPGKEKLGVLSLTISADLDGLICFLKNFQSCKTSFHVPSRDITWPYNLLNKKKTNNLISERLRPPPRQNSYGKEPKKWPSLINSVTHAFMQR